MVYCIDQDWDFEIIVVEDGSSDNSVNIVKEFCSKDKRIILLSLPERVGKGGSLLRAIRYCNKKYIGFMDVDLSADISEFANLMPYIENFDVVIGSRISPEKLNETCRPVNRQFLSLMYRLFFRCLFEIEIKDLQCGFKLFKKESLFKVISDIKINGYAFDTEFLVKSSLNRLKIKEIPIIWHHDSNSKINLYKTAFNMSKDLINIWITVSKIQIRENSLNKNQIVARPLIMYKIMSSRSVSKRTLKTSILNR